MIQNLIFSSFVASSSSEYKKKDSDGDGKEYDHLKKIPISGYIHDNSPVKPSRKIIHILTLSFKLQMLSVMQCALIKVYIIR